MGSELSVCIHTLVEKKRKEFLYKSFCVLKNKNLKGKEFD